MSGETQLLLMIAGVHVLGLACVAILMFPALRDAPEAPPWNDDGNDDGWGNRPREPRDPRDVPGGGLPLPASVPSRVRLRGPEKLHERLPRPQRRPNREPVRTPVREPSRYRAAVR